MDIKEEIRLLKIKIDNELNSMMYHKNFSKIVENLREQVDNPGKKFYDLTDIQHLEGINLLFYKEYLQSFLDYNIKVINELIASGKNNIFDNRKSVLLEEVYKHERDIDEVLSYLAENLLPMKEMLFREYQEIRAKYYPFLDDAYKQNEITLYQYLGIQHPVSFSLYESSDKLFEQYLRELEVFKIVYIDKLKIFVENDKKIKNSLAKARETFSNPEALEAINQLEQNYIENLMKCTTNLNCFNNSYVSKLQEEMINRSNNLDELIAKKRLRENYISYLNSITFKNYNINKLLEIEEYANKYDSIGNDFYTIIYMIIEKDKRVKELYGIDSFIYDKLSLETKLKLESIFVSRLSLLEKKEKDESLIEFNSKGYIETKDRGLDSFFETVIINDNAVVIENAPSIKLKPKNKWLKNEELARLEKLMIKNNPKYRRLIKKSLKRNWTVQIGDDMYCLRINDAKPYRYFYFDNDGNKLNLPDNQCMRFHVLNFFIDDITDEVLRTLDDKFNVIYKSDFMLQKIDWVIYNDKYLVVREVRNFEERINVFDAYGKLLVKADLKDVIKKISKEYTLKNSCFLYDKFKDGLIIVKLQNELDDPADFYVYNLYTKKILDKRKNKDDLSLDWFNERLPFINTENNLYGFKDYDGNIVIKPKYHSTTGFSGNLAFVSEIEIDKEATCYLIDKNGNNVDYEWPESSTIMPDCINDRLYITKNGKEIRSFRAKSDFRIDKDIPMLEYIRNNDETKILRK